MPPQQDQAPINATGMHLSRVTIENLRSCKKTTVKLQSQITLLVGENNSGKSNIVDAIRLSTGPLNGRRYRYFGLDDFCDHADGDHITIASEYSNLTAHQEGRFLTALDNETKVTHYTTSYNPDPSILPRLRTVNLCGPQPGADPEPENRARINHVYLPPLRNAQEALDSAQGGRLVDIVRSITSKEEQDSFLDQANSSLSEIAQHQVIEKSTTTLREHLGRLTNPVRGQDVSLSFQSMKLHRLIRSLRIKMAERGVDPADISQSGLGYANLLYIATVILELQNAPETELTVFLVEEPEAHLHPQLQGVLLDYLMDQTARSVQPDDTRPVGRIQVVATTHSPNLASSVGIENIVVVQRDTIDAETDHAGTKTLALSDIPLTADEKRKINQYLDVTRSELVFGRHAVLVEGIAETVLLPALVHRVFKSQHESERELHRKFAAASTINIGSVDFSPYIKLLAQSVDGIRLVDSLVVITDGDPLIPKSIQGSDQDASAASEADGRFDGEDAEALEDALEDEDETTAFNRKEALEELVAEISAEDTVFIYASTYTLEADLLEPVDSNKATMRKAFIKQKPRSGAKLDAWTTAESPSFEFYKKLQTSKGYLGKGEFAHELAMLIPTDSSFVCPTYLSNAIRKAAGASH